MSDCLTALPDVLHSDQRSRAVSDLNRYFGTDGAAGRFTGSYFDSWDSTGRRSQAADEFVADDLVAVSFLSVDVPALAARQLLVEQRGRFAELLSAVGPDRDLDSCTAAFTDEGPEWALYGALLELDGVGPTLASKLYARKRPRLRPIYDTVVAETLGVRRIWEPLRATLVECPGLPAHLRDLHSGAGLDPVVPLLRVFDVLVWMAGREHTTGDTFDPAEEWGRDRRISTAVPAEPIEPTG